MYRINLERIKQKTDITCLTNHEANNILGNSNDDTNNDSLKKKHFHLLFLLRIFFSSLSRHFLVISVMNILQSLCMYNNIKSCIMS